MSAAYEALAAGIVTAWVLFQGLRLFLPLRMALGCALALGVLPYLLVPHVPAFAMIIAVFAPFGVLLPVLAVQSLMRTTGVAVPRFATRELLLGLVCYVAFLSASLGVFDWDPYRLGYTPHWGGGIAVLIAAYGALRGHVGLSLAALLGQVLWMLDIGSSNYFDHISHALMVPILVVVLVQRGVRG